MFFSARFKKNNFIITFLKSCEGLVRMESSVIYLTYEIHNHNTFLRFRLLTIYYMTYLNKLMATKTRFWVNRERLFRSV